MELCSLCRPGRVVGGLLYRVIFMITFSAAVTAPASAKNISDILNSTPSPTVRMPFRGVLFPLATNSVIITLIGDTGSTSITIAAAGPPIPFQGDLSLISVSSVGGVGVLQLLGSLDAVGVTS